MQINKILISSDLLRPLVEKNGNIEYFHKARLDKYFYSLVYQIGLAVNVPVEKFSFSNTDFDFRKFYQLCGVELKDIYSWLNIYDLTDIPETAIEYYKKYIENSLVIYHEAPNIVKKIHNTLGILYIDLNVHPIRFLDDNFWGILTNCQVVFDRIKKYQIDERTFYIYANLIKSQVKGWDNSSIEPNSLLFTGQTNVDKSLYYSGNVMSIFDFESELQKYANEYSKIYYKPHPYNNDLHKVYDFLKQFNCVEITNENFYKLCSDENISAVCSITSGTLYEAKYFSKRSLFLGKPYLYFDYDKNCNYSESTTLSIYNEFLDPAFWADVLQDIISVKKDVKSIILPHRSNEIRVAFGDYWGQTELDPCVNMNKNLILSCYKKLSEIQSNIYDNINTQVHSIYGYIDSSINTVYSYIDSKINDIYVHLSKKLNKFIYKEKFGQKRIIHIGKIKIKYNKIKKNELYNYPHSLIVDTTMLCNNNCSFCWRSNNSTYLKAVSSKYKCNHTMKFKLFKKIIDDTVQYDSVRWFSLSGPMGDPMLNPEIENFYEYASSKKHFRDICVNTNGLAIHKHDIKKLMTNLTEFSISVDSVNPETYGKIHGSPTYLSQVIENIKSLIEFKRNNDCLAKIVVRFTENEINQGEFPEFEKFFFNLGVDEINYTKLHGFAGVHKELQNSHTAQSCQQILGAINFNFKGDMTTCCVNWQLEPTFGNIKNKTIKQMWNNRKMKSWLRNKLNQEPCKNCSGVGASVQHSIKITRKDYLSVNIP